MIPLDHLLVRRRQFLDRIPAPVLLFAGGARPRNYPDNPYPDRADSHFLFFFGAAERDAAGLFDPADGTVTLFLSERTVENALWMGPVPGFGEMRDRTGVDRVEAVERLEERVEEIAGGRPIHSVAVADPQVTDRARRITGIPLEFRDPDRIAPIELQDILADLRLHKLEPEVEEIRRAVAVTHDAVAAVMAGSRPGVREHHLVATLEEGFARHGGCPAFETILSVRGEILHNHHHEGTLAEGDLLLLDTGAEIESGYACDVTRTWPATGRFGPEQRAVYEIVLRANETGVAGATVGTRFRYLHLAAARVIAEGLVDLGILRGSPEDLVERGAHALFFPHGLGHFLGLDAHDLESFGDRVLYGEGRARSEQFGTAFLRIDRDLEPGMVVTIEPGIYFVPAILRHPELSARFADCVDFDRAEELLSRNEGRGFGGIRIEDDVRITSDGPEVLTAAIPKGVENVEALVGGGPAGSAAPERS
jgi:Xaa-Pro aminopeptidase